MAKKLNQSEKKQVNYHLKKAGLWFLLLFAFSVSLPYLINYELKAYTPKENLSKFFGGPGHHAEIAVLLWLLIPIICFSIIFVSLKRAYAIYRKDK